MHVGTTELFNIKGGMKAKIIAIWHFLVMLFGGVLVVSRLKNPKLIMLMNRIVIIIFITYKLYTYISYGK